MNSTNFPLSWFQRRRYSGKFVAVSNNKIYASDRSFYEVKHKARERLSGNSEIKRNLTYLYIGKYYTNIRETFLFLISLVIFESAIYQVISSPNVFLYKKIEIFIFYNSVIFSIFIASLLIISPVVQSRHFFGSIGKAIIENERHLGLEVALTGINVFIFLGVVILKITSSIEFNIDFDSIFIFSALFLLLLQIWFTLNEEKNLKKLHYYLIDLITMEDKLTYNEIVSYLSEIPEIKKRNISDTSSLLMTLEASLESPFSLTRVIAFNILFRDVAIMVGSIIISFGIGYILYLDSIVDNLIGTRIFGSFLAAGLLLFYAYVKRSTSSFFAESFVKSHSHFMLRPGGADRIYMKFFPNEVQEMKEKSILTILRQSLLLTTGLGLFFLLYGLELVVIINILNNEQLIEFINSISLAFGMIPVFLFILYVARAGTKTWIFSIESKMIQLDQQLETQIGISPNEILGYLHEAHTKYNDMFKNN